MKQLLFILITLLCFNFAGIASLNPDFKKIFKDRDGCFLLFDFNSQKMMSEYNPSRCQQRFSPYSTFKITAAMMAFEKGILKDENQVLKWDGVNRGREEINKDLTPLTWMSTSAKWVTEWIMPQVGQETIQSFLNAFNYGNKDFSGGFKDAWVSSSLKISAHEQINFLTNFWNQKLGLSSRTTDLTKKIMFIKKIGKNSELYGKTGTGCLVGHACMDRPDKMIGWFVGILKNDSQIYVFAGNASDLKPQALPAGPRMREATIEIINKMNLAD